MKIKKVILKIFIQIRLLSLTLSLLQLYFKLLKVFALGWDSKCNLPPFFKSSVIFSNKTNDKFVEIKHPVQQEKVPRFLDLLQFNQPLQNQTFLFYFFKLFQTNMMYACITVIRALALQDGPKKVTRRLRKALMGKFKTLSLLIFIQKTTEHHML